MADEPAVLTERRGRVLVITLNRPDAMNSINGALSHGVVDAIAELEADARLTAAILTGNGRGFCAGMDLKAFAAGEDLGPMFGFMKNGSKAGRPHRPQRSSGRSRIEATDLAGGQRYRGRVLGGAEGARRRRVRLRRLEGGASSVRREAPARMDRYLTPVT